MEHINNDSDKPKRRVRYKGKHPRQFKEKYKEHNFEKYPQDVLKVIASGKTPAGTHRPICVHEILDILKPAPGQIGMDATLGFGGHALELLKKIIPGGRLFALDVDPLELARTEKRLRAFGYSDKELTIKRSNFAGMFKLLDADVPGFDFILADLGISSMQLDNPARGFTFKREGPLDLRLNPQRGQSAAQLLKSLDEKQMEKLFIQNSDEPHAAVIAQAIFNNKDKINKTTELSDIIAYALEEKSYCDCSVATTTSIRRIFQALRIKVNDEFSALVQFLRKLPMCLKSKGRVAILSFHSGEDNRVMNAFKQGLKDGLYTDISHEPIRPNAEEQYANPRSNSALLRWAIRK
ncbi:16S rRNA (cytosine(1402)-N(4))-methyltransferase RsmH [Candidatus Omnitrophota bacterium]